MEMKQDVPLSHPPTSGWTTRTVRHLPTNSWAYRLPKQMRPSCSTNTPIPIRGRCWVSAAVAAAGAARAAVSEVSTGAVLCCVAIAAPCTDLDL